MQTRCREELGTWAFPLKQSHFPERVRHITCEAVQCPTAFRRGTELLLSGGTREGAEVTQGALGLFPSCLSRCVFHFPLCSWVCPHSELPKNESPFPPVSLQTPSPLSGIFYPTCNILQPKRKGSSECPAQMEPSRGILPLLGTLPMCLYNTDYVSYFIAPTRPGTQMKRWKP